MGPLVVVTRPEPEATRWAEALATRGAAAVALPLIDIARAADAAPLQAAWRHIERYRAALFVSSNAVAHFFEPNHALAPTGIAQFAINTRAWAPGPHTGAALRAAGVAAGRIDCPAADAPQFDSEALWPLVQAQVQPGDRVLLVRGRTAGPGEGRAEPGGASGNGREWIGARIAERGGHLDAVAVYERRCPVWTPAQRAVAESACTGRALWLFSSSEAIANLLQLRPGADWSRNAALATHPRVAAAAHAAGFGPVATVQPTLDAVAAALASIESLQ